MGNCLLLLGLKKEKRPVTLLLVGLDSAGKTTAAKGIVGDPVEDVAPTVGFAPEYLEYRGCEVTIYDLGGGAKIRPVWAKYFSEVHGVIFVVDSTAGARLGECREVLTALLADPKIAGKPVLILANKQDVDGAMDEIDLVEGLKVEEIVNRYKCPTRVETCSAMATRNRKPDKPIADGFRWLMDTIVVHYKAINTRVTKDLEREREEQRRELEERKERLRQLRAQSGGSGSRRSEVIPTIPTTSSTSLPPSPSSSSPSSTARASAVVTKAEVVVRGKEEGEEEEEVMVVVEKKQKSSSSSPTTAASKVPNGALPQHRTKAERQELKELGFESSGELGASSSSSSSSSSSLVKDTATTKTPVYGGPQSPPRSPPASTPAPHRVIVVKESSSSTAQPPPPPLPPEHHQGTTTTITTATTTTTTTTTTSTATTTASATSTTALSPSVASLSSGGHHTSRLDLSSERRQSECIPIDSDDEMFDLPPPLLLAPPHHHHHHLHHNNYFHHSDSSTSPGTSAKATSNNNNNNNNNNNINNSSSSVLELETASKPAKKKSFLKRYHKTAPLVTRDQEVPPQQA